MFDAVDIVAAGVGAAVIALITFLLVFTGSVITETRITTQCEAFNAFHIGEKVYECKRRAP